MVNYDDVNDAADDWQSVSEFNHYTEKVENKKLKAKDLRDHPPPTPKKKKSIKGKSKEQKLKEQKEAEFEKDIDSV